MVVGPPVRALRLLFGMVVAATWVLSACRMTPAETNREWSRYGVEVEGGALWQSKNDVGVPGDTGTRFSMSQLMGSGPSAYARLRLGYRFTPTQELRLLWAPLSMSGSGALQASTQFDGQTYAAGVPTNARYRLDSYQLTWRALVYEDDVWDCRAGLSGRYLDGGADLSQASVAGSYSDDGFLPLLHFDASAKLSPAWRAVLDADAGGLSQKRMFDFSVQLRTLLSDGWELGFGYRGMEAWFESDEAVNFPWFHAGLVSLGYRL